ncbi:MAG TPA: BamA/TamA family outer membrane protein [Gemmatimonadaceae bacterium]|nr:BamA/TamA family outer membrane protein [Gemmatimonadaceae bacterium]
MRGTASFARPLGWALASLAALAASAPTSAHAQQYFGRNKVQYETFDFRILRTEHFDIYYYPAESLAAADAGRMAERWYERHSRTLRFTFARNPLIFYADHPDFQQNNVIGGFISQGTGGVTEGGRNRVVMPFTGVYADNDHVLGHELVHVFQYDIAGSAPGGMQGMNNLPLWLIEGMAEYLSVGRADPHTAMWLRDAAVRNDLPTIKQLSTDPRFFPYRYGQALWAYIGGRWGDAAVGAVYRAALRTGMEGAVRAVLGLRSDSLSKEWLAAIREQYTPLIQGRQPADSVGVRVLGKASKRGDMDLSPSLSPDGKYVAFISGRGIFTVDLYIADAQTGEIINRFTSPNRDAHFDAISYINSAGSWSPDGRKLAYVVQVEGDNAIGIFDVSSRRVERQIRVRGVGEITDPAWSPDGRSIAFAGSAGGIGDLYLLDLQSERVRQLTNDRNADLQPAWSPDGRTLAFASDRGDGQSGGSSFEQLSYSPMRISLLDVESGELRTLPLFAGAKHINPQWSPDGRDIYFISDRQGFSDIYRATLGDDRRSVSAVYQVTRLVTGVSGITASSPALSVAQQTGRLMFSVFDRAGNSIFRLEPDAARGQPVTAGADTNITLAGLLPPARSTESRGLVSLALQDPTTGLPSSAQFTGSAYRRRFSLDYLGSPGVGVAVGPRGAGAVGGIVGYFSDMLSDQVIGATIQGGGQSYKDFGGELFYLNQRRRWNWFGGVAHIPYLSAGAQVSPGPDENTTYYDQIFFRQLVTQGSLGAQYPFSQTRRFELNASATRLAYDVEVDRYTVDAFGTPINLERNARVTTFDTPPAVAYYQPSAALVADYSIFGMTSPIAGGRWRLEATPTFGDVKFTSALADYRRYFYARPVTFAFRGLHYGRYGGDSEDFSKLGPLYLGQEQLIRGYNVESIDASECTGLTESSQSCPVLDRLIGSRLAVVNAELRVPLLGPREISLIGFNFVPVELAPFVDAGTAWTAAESPKFTFSRSSSERIPVVSTGAAARINVLGYLVAEIYYAYPFQRPERGGHVGFNLAPGW